MNRRNALLAVLFIALVQLGCKKDSSDQRCQELKQAMRENNVASAKNIIANIIQTLPSDIYSEQTVNSLASVLSNECGLSAEVLCFSCIQTLPEQTEIRVSFTASGNIVNKILDISFAGSNNKMNILNIHD